MNECMLRLQKPEELDRQREIMIAEKIEKIERSKNEKK